LDLLRQRGRPHGLGRRRARVEILGQVGFHDPDRVLHGATAPPHRGGRDLDRVGWGEPDELRELVRDLALVIDDDDHPASLRE
jgi:hypothetical protein